MPPTEPSADSTTPLTPEKGSLVREIVGRSLRFPSEVSSEWLDSYENRSLTSRELAIILDEMLTLTALLQERGYDERKLSSAVLEELILDCLRIIEPKLERREESASKQRLNDKVMRLFATARSSCIVPNKATIWEGRHERRVGLRPEADRRVTETLDPTLPAPSRPEQSTRKASNATPTLIAPMDVEHVYSSRSDDQIRRQLREGFVYRCLYHLDRTAKAIFISPNPITMRGINRSHFVHVLHYALRNARVPNLGHQGLWFMEVTTESPSVLQKVFRDAVDIRATRRIKEEEEKAGKTLEEKAIAAIRRNSEKLAVRYFCKRFIRELEGDRFGWGGGSRFYKTQIKKYQNGCYSKSHRLGLRYFIPDRLSAKERFGSEHVNLYINSFGLPYPSVDNDQREAVWSWLNRGPYSCHNECYIRYINYVADFLKQKDALTPSQVIQSLENFDEAELLAIAEKLGQHARQSGREDLFAELVGPPGESRVSAVESERDEEQVDQAEKATGGAKESIDRAGEQPLSQSDRKERAAKQSDRGKKPVAVECGNNLVRARQAKGWKTLQLANSLKITEEELARYESGEDLPGTELMTRIANKLGVSLEQLAPAGFQSANRRKDDELSEKQQKALLYGAKLTAIHERSRMSVQEVTEKIGKNRTQLYKYLGGKNLPNLEIRIQLAFAYGEPSLQEEPTLPAEVSDDR